MTKVCNYCKEEKSINDFAEKKHGKHGVRARCKICTNRFERNEYAGKPRENKDRHLRKTYGISIDDYEAIFRSQRGICILCWLPERAKGKSLAVDHNHRTGMVRGLLCHRCNAGLGQLSDDIIMLERAIAYLKSYNEVE